MNILFVDPPRTHWAVSLRLHKTISEEAGLYPTLGPLYVATNLKKNSGHNVAVLDCTARKFGFEELRRAIAEFEPDIVGIYFCTEYLYDARKTARAAKEVDGNIVTVAGGPHVYIYPKETIKYPEVDYCVYGEGEYVFRDFADCVASGSKTPDSIAGIISKKNAAADHSPARIDDIDAPPFPDRRLTDCRAYHSFITYANPVATMITSRGCVYNCHYCNSIERAKKIRMVSAGKVADEIEDIVNQGIRDILIFDENFTLDTKRVGEICEEIVARGLRVRWHCRSRADMKLDEKILRKMKSAGCRMIQFGVETGSPRLQKVINKNLDLEKVSATISLVKKAGILTYGNFMFGLPTETKEETERTLRYAKDLDLDYASLSVFNPLPDSEFYLRALADGTIKSDYWREFAEGKTDRIDRYTWPLHDQEYLTRVNRAAYGKFYMNPGYILKALARKQSLRQKLWQIRAGLKIIFGG